MSNPKNQKISQKSSPGPDLSNMLITLALYKSGNENDVFYLHALNVLWAKADDGAKELIREYFDDLMAEKKKEIQKKEIR
ncbi:MAG: hypothetical protein KAR42_16680 [candidate division Zixibacteria bacterium]|nr:hypothetical protein [candidate division Zixibacteria bacterium]